MNETILCDRENKIRIAFDMFVLGQGIKTGVYRVCDEIFSRLAKEPAVVPFATQHNGQYEKQSRAYLAEKGLDWTWHIPRRRPSRDIDVLVSPFFAPWGEWATDHGLLKVFIAYDLIALRFPQLFEEGHAQLGKHIYDNLNGEELIFSISQNTKNDLLGYRPDIAPERIVVMPLAAGNQFFPCHDADKRAAVRAKYGIPANAPYFLSLATLEIRKNLHQVLKAFSQLMKIQPQLPVYLILAGMQGWKLDELKSALDGMGIARNRVVLPGFVEDEDLSALYSDALCFIYMSLYEGFGLPPLEAMACGTPVIASNSSSLPEVVDDAGILLNPQDTDGLCAAMGSMLADAAMREKLAAKGLERSRKFSWNRSVEIMMEAIQKELGPQSKRSIITYKTRRRGALPQWLKRLLQPWNSAKMIFAVKQLLPEKIKRPLRPAWNWAKRVRHYIRDCVKTARHAGAFFRHNFTTLSATLLCRTEILMAWIFSSRSAQDPQQILIVRIDAIGDYMLFRPALRQLCTLQAFQGKRITLCGNAIWQDLAVALDGSVFNNFIPFRGHDFSNGKYRRTLFKMLRDVGASVALYPTLSRDFIGDTLILASGAEERVGFDCPPQNITKICKKITDKYYTRIFTPDPGYPFELYRNYEFLRHLGWTPGPIHLELPKLSEDITSTCSTTVKAHLGSPIFFIGAQVVWRRWPATLFAALAREINHFCNRPVVLAGGNDCVQDALHIQNECALFVSNLVGMTTLAELATLLAHAPFAISNDSSGGHIAAAFNTPTVFISNGQHSGRFHPYPSKIASHVRVVYPPGFATDMDTNRTRYYWSMSPLPIDSVSVAQVVETLAQLLGSQHGNSCER